MLNLETARKAIKQSYIKADQEQCKIKIRKKHLIDTPFAQEPRILTRWKPKLLVMLNQTLVLFAQRSKLEQLKIIRQQKKPYKLHVLVKLR